MSTLPTPGPAPAPAPAPAPTSMPPTPTPAPPPNDPERPEGVSDAEWAALGDPGKAALVRERARANAAERALTQRNPAPAPSPTPTPTADPAPTGGKPADPTPPTDVAAIVEAAVSKALAPFQEQSQQREANEAATRIRDAVEAAARGRLHDPTDALAHIDLTAVTDGNGQADSAKITGAIDDLITRKPHLGQVIDPRRQPLPGSGLGVTTPGGAAPLDDRVKATLAAMQSAVGIKPS